RRRSLCMLISPRRSGARPYNSPRERPEGTRMRHGPGFFRPAPGPIFGEKVSEGGAAMLRVEPSGAAIGARVSGVDLARLDEADFAAFEDAIARHAVLAVTDQRLDPESLLAFSRRLGDVYENPTSAFKHDGCPEVMILSN